MGILILIIIILILCIGKGSSGYDNSGEYCCPYCGRCYNNEDDYLDCISRDEYDIDEGIW